MKNLLNGEVDSDLTGFENGHQVPIADENSGEELLVQCAERCQPRISVNQAAQALEFYDTNYSSSDLMLKGSLSEALREQSKKIHEFYERAFELLANCWDNQTSPKMMRMSFASMCLTLGFTHAANARTYLEIATNCKISRLMGQSGKQTVCKRVQKFVRQLKIKKIAGQRDEASRNSMAQSRVAQLKPSQRNGENHEPKEKNRISHLPRTNRLQNKKRR